MYLGPKFELLSGLMLELLSRYDHWTEAHILGQKYNILDRSIMSGQKYIILDRSIKWGQKYNILDRSIMWGNIVARSSKVLITKAGQKFIRGVQNHICILELLSMGHSEY